MVVKKSYLNTISVLHLNVRSMKPHFDKLEALVNGLESPLEVLCLTETWLSKNDNFNAYLINGCNQLFVKKKRDSGRGGGVMMQVKSYCSRIKSFNLYFKEAFFWKYHKMGIILKWGLLLKNKEPIKKIS